MEQFPARIHVLLARQAPIGVVIRRGPAKAVATLLWDRQNDTFQLGQWFRGRIYERRCDLSPDGRHLLYFAMSGHWEGESKGSWTAISRAPFLKAIAMFPKGDGWNGGGLWTSPTRYWLNEGGISKHSVLRNTSEVSRDTIYHPETYFGGECLGVYYPRLMRDGWKLIEELGTDDFDIFEKPIGKGWVLRKKANAGNHPKGKSIYWDEHELIHPDSNALIPCPKWEWAELDGNRLVWAADGILNASQVAEGGIKDQTKLFDFNSMKFERIRAPY